MTELFRPSCSRCGTEAPSTQPPSAWSMAIRDGRREWTCPSCARANVRNIEGGLDAEWW